ncbi:MAG: NAD(P) transhydrogenase subunit alpha [Acidimicrobiales bacterium]
MTSFFILFFIFVLSVFLGYEVISKVPSVLHTPLMSGTNAIHGIILVGAIAVLATADSALLKAIGFVAVVLATLNVVGGFVVTDRMLEMFKGRSQQQQQQRAAPAPEPEPGGPDDGGSADITRERTR